MPLLQVPILGILASWYDKYFTDAMCIVLWLQIISTFFYVDFMWITRILFQFKISTQKRLVTAFFLLGNLLVSVPKPVFASSHHTAAKAAAFILCLLCSFQSSCSEGASLPTDSLTRRSKAALLFIIMTKMMLLPTNRGGATKVYYSALLLGTWTYNSNIPNNYCQNMRKNTTFFYL